MTVEQATRWRKISGRLNALLLLAVVLAILDGFSAQIQEEFNQIDLIAGQGRTVNGPMPRMAAALRELTVDLSSDALTLKLEDTYTGFWMGGSMWKGELSAAPGSPSGRHTLAVRGPGEAEAVPALAFKLRVWATDAEQRAASPSLVRRLLGPQPFVLAAWLLPCALLGGLLHFVGSQKLEAALAREGKAEVYVLKADPEGLLLTFGLGAAQGVEPGGEALILDDTGNPAAAALIRDVRPGSATALAPVGSPVRIGSLVQVRPARA
jgi:hypothetical protein